jgi:hypothetical protein
VRNGISELERYNSRKHVKKDDRRVLQMQTFLTAKIKIWHFLYAEFYTPFLLRPAQLVLLLASSVNCAGADYNLMVQYYSS